MLSIFGLVSALSLLVIFTVIVVRAAVQSRHAATNIGTVSRAWLMAHQTEDR